MTDGLNTSAKLSTLPAADDQHGSLYRTRFGDQLWQPDSYYVVIGTDQGRLIHHILTHTPPKSSVYLFIELDEQQDADTVEIPEHYADNLVVCSPQHWLTQATALRLGHYIYKGNVNLIRSNNAHHNLPHTYSALAREVEEKLKSLIWKYSSQFDYRLHYKTQLINYPDNHTSAASLKNIFQGKTALILAAGPSLDTLLPWLQAHRDQAVVIAVSRIAAKLSHAGLTPDIFVTSDPQEVSFTVCAEMLEFGEHTLLAYANNASPRLIGQWTGPAVYLKTLLPWHDTFAGTEDNITICPPTVTNSAINLALAMGCSHIALAGVDLCYNAQGFTHASGTTERNAAGPLINELDHIITTNDGREADTNQGYYEAIESLSKQAEQALAQGCVITNLAPDAAKIDHVQYTPAENYEFATVLNQPAWETITSALPEQNRDYRAQYLKNAATALERNINTLRKIKRLAKEALHCNSRLIAKDGVTLSPKHKNKMDKIERQLSKECSTYDTIIKYFNGRRFSQMLSGASSEEWSLDDMVARGKMYYDAYQEGAQTLLALLEIVAKKITGRLAEESAAPDFEALFQQWRHNRQPGRAKVWRLRHADAYQQLSAEIKVEFGTLENELLTTRQAEEDQYKTFFEQQNIIDISTEKLLDKSLEFFEHRNRAGLERLHSGLEYREHRNHQQIRLLVTGLIAELDDNTEHALETYRQLDGDTLWPTKQVALERTLNMMLEREDYATALDTITQLAARVASYAPLHAQFLALTGDTTCAVSVYTDYLEQHPTDLDTMAQLGALFKELGSIEGVQWALTHIRNHDPNHAGINMLQ